MSDIKQPIQDLSNNLKGDMKLGAGGVVETPTDFYKKNLPEGITMEIVESVQNHDAAMVAASGLAFGELSIEAMRKDKKLEETSICFNAGKTTMAHTFKRVKEVATNRPGEPRKTAPKFGVTSSSVTSFGSSRNGVLKKVHVALSEKATKLLG